MPSASPLAAVLQRSRQVSVVPQGVAAMPADSLVDALGTRMDVSSPSSAYGDDNAVLDAIALPGRTGPGSNPYGLGLRHLRESPTIGNANAEQMFALIAALDVGGNGQVINPKFTSNIGQIIGGGGSATVNSPNATPVATVFDNWEANFDPAWWDQIEGPNEPNGRNGDKWLNGVLNPPGWDWAAEVRNRLSAAAAIIRTTRAATWGHVKLAGPSLVAAGTVSAQQLGNIEAWVDRGNIHYYTRGLPPSGMGGTQGEVLATKIKVTRDYMVPTKPLVTTESGMHDAYDVRDANGAPSLFRPTPSSKANGKTWPDVQKVYVPKLLMENLWAGQKILWWNELVDDTPETTPPYQDHEGHMGWYDHSWAPKTSVIAMQRLLNLFRDPGTTTFNPQPLVYTVAGDPADMRQLLYQRRNGKWLLALWREVSIWDRETTTSITVDPVQVTVTVNPARTVNLYRPSLQATVWLAKGSVPSFDIDLAEELVICEIT